MSSEGPSSKTKNSFFLATNSPNPPGKKASPVKSVKTSAAALEKVE